MLIRISKIKIQTLVLTLIIACVGGCSPNNTASNKNTDVLKTEEQQIDQNADVPKTEEQQIDQNTDAPKTEEQQINQNADAPTADQIRQLKAVGIPVVMPNYLPSGFRLTDFNIDITTSPNNPEGIQSRYRAIYNGPNSCEFTFDGTNGGFGDAGGDNSFPVNTPLFGEITVEEQGNPNNLISQGAKIKDPPEYISAETAYVFQSSCEHSTFSHQSASRILQSARIVK